MNTTTLMNRSLNYALLMRFDRPIGIYLLLWPALWALWIAGEGHPSTENTLIFVLGVIIMRAAGCVINDFADRDIDPFVRRTELRPLATGAVSPIEAIVLFIILGLVAFVLVLFTNWLTFFLSLAALFLAMLYPFTKRYTYMPQAFLGLAFGWAVPMAFAAQTGSVPLVAWLILTATVLWATAYDTMYAMVDREDDIRVGVKSTAILFGEADIVIIGAIQGLFYLTIWIIGTKLHMGPYYYAGLLVAAGFGVYQQYLIREREPGKCFKAFLNNSWVGAALFAGIVLHYQFSG
jgi:4-hydroxybenzoate polyprenyltransferase